MKIYFAGESPIGYDILAKCGVKNVLKSYFYIKNTPEHAHKLNETFYLFVDSGAFSAYTQKASVNLDAYIEFIKKLNPPIYAGLDVIKDAEATIKNIEYMESKGLNPIPTFHRMSDMKYLYRMVDKYDYIALGGLAGTKTARNQIFLWLDRVFTYIRKTKPSLKVHGFACSGKDVMRYYPWYSVDSTSWLAPVIFGREVDGKSNREILEEKSKTNDVIYHNKLNQRIAILEESIKSFLNLEQQINNHHTKSEFQHLNQIELF